MFKSPQVFLTFVINVRDNGSDGPKHAANCCTGLQCFVWLHTSFIFQIHDSLMCHLLYTSQPENTAYVNFHPLFCAWHWFADILKLECRHHDVLGYVLWYWYCTSAQLFLLHKVITWATYFDYWTVIFRAVLYRLSHRTLCTHSDPGVLTSVKYLSQIICLDKWWKCFTDVNTPGSECVHSILWLNL